MDKIIRNIICFQQKSRAFTLAETLITVVILGIVAAILVPNLINRQVENANRTKVKKAMAAYEKAINFIILENDIKSTEELKEFGEEETCKFSKAYFKTVQDGKNDCIFKTADRVWWNITDLTNPIIILKDSQKDKSKTELQTLAKDVNDKTVFSMVGRFDDLGTLRVNDNAYEQSLSNNFTNQKYVGKLWYFITQSSSVLIGFDKCNVEKTKTCVITIDGVSTTYTKVTTTKDTEINKADGKPFCIYKKDSNPQQICNYISTAPKGDYWISDASIGNITNMNQYEATKRKCEAQGAHLASLAELEIARSKNKLGNNSIFWSSEQPNSSQIYYLRSSGSASWNWTGSATANYKVICVGNN